MALLEGQRNNTCVRKSFSSIKGIKLFKIALKSNFIEKKRLHKQRIIEINEITNKIVIIKIKCLTHKKSLIYFEINVIRIFNVNYFVIFNMNDKSVIIMLLFNITQLPKILLLDNKDLLNCKIYKTLNLLQKVGFKIQGHEITIK